MLGIMKKKKNKGAVHLGKLSAIKRRKKAGSKKAFSEQMKAVRAKGKQKGQEPWAVV